MATFVFVYKMGCPPAAEPSPAEMEAVMAAWRQWFEGLGPAVADIGTPFSAATTVGPDGVADGGASELVGYSIFKADDLSAAAAIAKTCPIVGGGGSVEVYESHAM
jgi:hypothetical protein